MRIKTTTNEYNGRNITHVLSDTVTMSASEWSDASHAQVLVARITHVEASTHEVTSGGTGITLELTTPTGHVSVTLHGNDILDRLATVICGEQWVAAQSEPDEVLA